MHLLKTVRLRTRLDGRKTSPMNDLVQAVFNLLGRSAPAGRGVHPDAVATSTSQELVNRNTVRFALQVPKRDLDPADGRVDHRSAGKTGPVVKNPVQMLDPRRILSDQPFLEIVDDLIDGLVWPNAIRLADP